MGKPTGSSVRDRLLQAGVTVFSRTGFNGSSVQDITDAAGVPKGSFYNHFDSKERLGAAAIAHFWEEQAGGTLAILRGGAVGDGAVGDGAVAPLERLRRYFAAVAVEVEGMGYTCGCFVGNMTAEVSDHSAVITDELSAIFAEWTRVIAGCIRLAQEDGSIASRADPEVLATFTLNAWEGALLRARVIKSSRPLHQFIDTLFNQLLA